MKKYNGKIAQEILEKNLLDTISNFHKDYIDFENKMVSFDDLPTSSQKYIKEIKKLYNLVISGKLRYYAIDQKTKSPDVDDYVKAVYRDAKHKIENKVTRAVLRRELVKTNNQINYLAATTNGLDFYNRNINVNESFARSSVNKYINEKFCELVNLGEFNINLLNIHGLSSLNTFRKLIVENYEQSDDKKQNSLALKEAVEESVEKFQSYINEGVVNPNDVYELTNMLSASQAKTLLTNITDDVKIKCVSECPYVVNTNTPYMYSSVDEEENNSHEEETPILYYDGIYGNPLTLVNGEFYTQDGKSFEGDVFALNTETDDFDYLTTIDSQDQDELDNIRQNKNENYNDGR